VAPPYVLVGHSLGGISMRLFAARYPAEVAGVVLVDATPTTFLDDACAIVDAKRCADFRTSFEPDRNDGVGYSGATDAILAAGPFPAVPLIVLAADDHAVGSMAPVMAIAFEAMWLDRQEELAASVAGADLRRIASGHNIQRLHPEAVLDAVAEVLSRLGAGAAPGAGPADGAT
jgi:pimeloyl-ACP methyl ester carboxylesterase